MAEVPALTVRATSPSILRISCLFIFLGLLQLTLVTGFPAGPASLSQLDLVLQPTATASLQDTQLEDVDGDGSLELRRESGEETRRIDQNEDKFPETVPVTAAEVAPAYTPIVTPAPNQDALLAGKGYQQITYYSCTTRRAQQQQRRQDAPPTSGDSTSEEDDVVEHCGWHVPLVKMKSDASRGRGGAGSSRLGGGIPLPRGAVMEGHKNQQGSRRMDTGTVVAAVALVTAVFVAGLL